MKKALILRIFLVLIVISAFYKEAPASDTTGVKKKGLVIYRDRILEPPFEFTGFEEDTLRLNGIPYFPVRVSEKDRRERGKLLPDSLIEKIKAKLEKERLLWKRPPEPEGTHELGVSAYEQAKKAKTYEEKKTIFARIMAKSPHVDSTRIMGNTVAVYWKHDRPEAEYCTIPIEDLPPLTEEQRLARRLELRRCDVKSFWRTYNEGGTIVFGAGHGITYAPESSTPRNLRAINKILSGGTLTEREKRSTVFNQKTLYKLYIERYKRGKGKK